MVDDFTNNGSAQNNGSNGGGDNGARICLYSRSQMFYFWPVWLTALGLWFLSNRETPPWQEYYAPFMTFVLFYVITATSVALRGLWFFVVSLVLIILGMALYMGGYVFDIIEFIKTIDIKMNADFYKVLGSSLFVIWLLTTFIYDRLRYVELTPSQLKLVREVGEKHENFDTLGMAFTKRRDNVAQHFFLGLGSGDLIIRPGNRSGNNEQIRFNNVLGVGEKIKTMNAILAKRHGGGLEQFAFTQNHFNWHFCSVSGARKFEYNQIYPAFPYLKSKQNCSDDSDPE